MHYVEIKDGVVSEPKKVSNSRTASPNTHWSAEQMKKHGYFIVDVSHDDQVEKIDYDNPIITDNAVDFAKIPLDSEVVKGNKKKEKIARIKARFMNRIKDKNDIWDILFALMGFDDIEPIKTDIDLDLKAMRQKIKAVKDASTVEEIEQVNEL